MNSPLVSVIIPNYNHAPYLPERIESVLHQTYHNFEVIILDDCSTDNSREVIEKYRNDCHVSQIVFNEQNCGSPFIQWNKGFELAKGEWIWIAESDDSCEPNFLEALIGQIRDSSSFVFCRSQRINKYGEPITDHWQDELKGSFTMDGRQFIDKYLIWRCIVWNASSVMFRKEFACQIPPVYKDFRAAGDWLFWVCLSWLGNVSFIDSPLNYFRLHDTNTTQNSFKNGVAKEERIKIYNFLISEGYISRQNYSMIRKIDAYSIYEDSNLSKETVNKLLDSWNITIIEHCYFWSKKMYKRIISILSPSLMQ